MVNKYLIALSLLVSTAISDNVAAAGLDDAVEAMRAGDFAEAYCIIRPLAESGDADAQYNIGWMYLNGYGLRINDTLALEWWQRASKQGHIDASFSIGMLYSLGEGRVAKDLDLAIDYYLLAARNEQEDAIALLQSMMMRNDKAILSRMNDIVNQYGLLFGKKRLVKAKKLNARDGPSAKEKIVAKLIKEQAVLELYKKGRWSQVALLGDAGLGRTVWVYNPLLEASQ
jgi:TPR repeat protein